MKLSQLTTKFKTLILSEILDDIFISKNDNCLFNYEKEQYICNTHKSKLKSLKTNSDKSEIYEKNECFVSNQNLYILRTKKIYIDLLVYNIVFLLIFRLIFSLNI